MNVGGGGVTAHFLIGFEAGCMGGNACLTLKKPMVKKVAVFNFVAFQHYLLKNFDDLLFLLHYNMM